MSQLAQNPTAYLIDENGIPIKPGYRKPFQKGYDPRRYKGQRKLTITDASKLIEKLQSMLDDASSNKRKSLSKPRSATNHGVVTRDLKVASSLPTISPRAVKKNASAVKPEGINPAVSPVVSPKPTIAPPGQPTSQAAQEPDDDCLF